MATEKLVANIRIKIAPVRVGFLDELDLPCPFPCLDRFFSTDRRLHRIVQLISDQIMHAVAFGKTFDNVLSMLPDAANQARGNSYVQRRVSSIGKDINAWLSFAHNGRPLEPCPSMHDGRDRCDCHSSERCYPASLPHTNHGKSGNHWIPAFAGMTPWTSSHP